MRFPTYLCKIMTKVISEWFKICQNRTNYRFADIIPQCHAALHQNAPAEPILALAGATFITTKPVTKCFFGIHRLKFVPTIHDFQDTTIWSFEFHQRTVSRETSQVRRVFFQH